MIEVIEQQIEIFRVVLLHLGFESPVHLACGCDSYPLLSAFILPLWLLLQNWQYYLFIGVLKEGAIRHFAFRELYLVREEHLMSRGFMLKLHWLGSGRTFTLPFVLFC